MDKPITMEGEGREGDNEVMENEKDIMKTELTRLRGKVTRMEEMLQEMNDKIGTIIDKFQSHRANWLRVEQDLCSTLVSQLSELKSGMADISKAKPKSHRKKPRRSYDFNVNQNVDRVLLDDQMLRFIPILPRPGTTDRAGGITGIGGIPSTSGTGASAILIPVSLPVGTGASGSNTNTFSLPTANVTPTRPAAPIRIQRVPVQTTKSTNSCGGVEVMVDVDDLDDIKLESMDEEFLSEPGNLDEDQDVEVIETRERTALSFETVDLIDSDSGADECSVLDPEFLPTITITPSKPKPKSKTKMVKVPALQNTKVTPLLLVRKFTSLAEARNRAKVEGKWNTKTTTRNSQGRLNAMHYVCKVDSKCPIKMIHKVDEETGAVTEYICGGPINHNHDPSNQSTTTRRKQALYHRPD